MSIIIPNDPNVLLESHSARTDLFRPIEYDKNQRVGWNAGPRTRSVTGEYGQGPLGRLWLWDVPRCLWISARSYTQNHAHMDSQWFTYPLAMVLRATISESLSGSISDTVTMNIHEPWSHVAQVAFQYSWNLCALSRPSVLDCWPIAGEIKAGDKDRCHPMPSIFSMSPFGGLRNSCFFLEGVACRKKYRWPNAGNSVTEMSWFQKNDHVQIFQQLMQERITIRFRPGLELRLFPNPRHSQVDSDREKHGKHMGKTMKKTTCSIYFDTTSCNFRPSQSCHTIFSVFFFTRKPLLAFTFPGIPDEVAEVALLEVAHFERQRIHVRGGVSESQVGLPCGVIKRVWKILKWKCIAGKTIEQNTGLLVCLTTGGYQ